MKHSIITLTLVSLSLSLYTHASDNQSLDQVSPYVIHEQESDAPREEFGAGIADLDDPNQSAATITENQPTTSLAQDQESGSISYVDFDAIKETITKEVVMVAGGTCLMGCGAYALYQSYYNQPTQAPESEKIVISAREKEILLGFQDAMAQDVKMIRERKRKQYLVQKFDFSALSMPLIGLCNYLQNVFVHIYNQCDEQGAHADTLNLFYCECSDAITALIEHAEVA